MSNRIQLRRDTSINWTTVNPILSDGEPGYEYDTGNIKYGDGSTNWTGLSYFSSESGYLDIRNSNVVLDGGNSHIWGGTVTGYTDLFGFTNPIGNNTLFSLSSNGSNGMSIQNDGNIFVGDGLGSAPFGINASSEGWVITQSGIATNGDCHINGKIFDSNSSSGSSGQILSVASNGNIQWENAPSVNTGEFQFSGYDISTNASISIISNTGNNIYLNAGNVTEVTTNLQVDKMIQFPPNPSFGGSDLQFAVTNAPINSQGFIGDQIGMIAFDSTNIYHCIESWPSTSSQYQVIAQADGNIVFIATSVWPTADTDFSDKTGTWYIVVNGGVPTLIYSIVASTDPNYPNAWAMAINQGANVITPGNTYTILKGTGDNIWVKSAWQTTGSW